MRLNEHLGIVKTGPLIIRFKTDFLCFQLRRLCCCFSTKAFLLSVMSAIQNQVTVCVITLKGTQNWDWNSQCMFIDQYATVSALMIMTTRWCIWKHCMHHFTLYLTIHVIKYFCAALFSCLCGNYFWPAISWLRWPRMQAPFKHIQKRVSYAARWTVHCQARSWTGPRKLEGTVGNDC